MERRSWAKRVWDAWISGVVPEEVERAITAENQAVEQIRAFVRSEEGPSSGVCLVEGEYGDGKSHLLRFAMWEAQDAGQRAAYLSCDVEDFGGRLRELFAKATKACSIQLETEGVAPETWFRLAKVAKEMFPREFGPSERQFIYNLGRYAARGWPLSEKQKWWAQSVMAQALVCGAVEELNEAFRKEVLKRCGGPMLWCLDEAESVLEGSRSRFRGLKRLIELTSTGRLPLRLLVAVTPELRRVLEEWDVLKRKGVRRVRIPPLMLEEAVRLIEIVRDVYRLARGQEQEITVGLVRQWLERYPKRRVFIQAVVRYLQTAG